MKKFLFIWLALVMVLPTFGQKRNQRGEKMVSYVIIHDGHGAMSERVDFEYDADGNLVSMVHLSNGNGLEAIKTEDGFKVTRYINNKPEKPGKQVRVEADDNGLITYMEQREYLGKTGFFFYESWELDYSVDPRSHQYTLCQETLSRGDNDGHGENHQWKYLYDNGTISRKHWDPNYGGYDQNNKETIIYHNGIVNDTNINLMASLLIGCSCFNEYSFLRLSPWCPITCEFFPDKEIDNKGNTKAVYKYTEANGNVTMVEKLRVISPNGKTARGNWIEICYVEG